ncbi:MAG: glycosyltransferase family 2 protein [Acutalibacteraceae bacterium]|nr:glycosyltransferase family 2 protein [Acutalibacteraceae bacterium]
MPLISIIVPVYNVEKVLHNCIESILSQTFTDFELLLIDDGSPDNSGAICDKYADRDSRIKVIHKENAGVSTARNTGFFNATGKYIVCVDSDDYINDDYLQSFINIVDKYPDAEMVWCGFSTVRNYEKSIIQKVNYNNDEITESDISEIMTLHEKWLDASPCNKLYLRENIVKNNLKMDINLSLGEDLLFNYSYIDICKNKKIYISNNCTYNYFRSQKESLDNKFLPDMFEIYKYINSKLKYYIDKWNLDDKQKQIFYNSAYYSYERCLRNTFNNSNKADKKEKYKINDKILRSSEFKAVLEKSDCIKYSLIKFTYKTGKYILVEKINNIISCLHKLKR